LHPSQGFLAPARHPWPGNVRELRNFVERLTLLRGDGPLVVDARAAASLGGVAPAPPPDAASASISTPLAGLGTRSYRELVEEFERGLVRAALDEAGGNVAEAARLLKVDRGNLHRRIRALGLAPPGAL
jgi:DNA-binding NtrC family response regulator